MSRAGSQVMKRGRSGGRPVELGVVDVEGSDGVEEEERSGDALTRSIIVAILSSSSGQISGQCENPK